VCWIVYTMLHTIHLKASCQMHFVTYAQVHSEVHSEVQSQLRSMAHFQLAWPMLPSKLLRHSQVHSKYVLKYTSSLLDYMLPNKLSVYSQIHSGYTPKYTSEYILKYTPGHASQDSPNFTRWHTPCVLDCTPPTCSQDTLKYTSNCTWWYIPSLLGSTLLSTLSTRKKLPNSLDYMNQCNLLHAQSRDLRCCRHQALGVLEYGAKCLAHIIWHVAHCWWQTAYVGWSHNVHWYGSLYLIFSVATMTRSHDTSRLWC
jgi:hypothetical protein